MATWARRCGWARPWPDPVEAAPFQAELAEGPKGGHALWLRAADGLRLRIAVWPGGGRGTVLIFPGRTEFAEKYGRVAGDLAAAGFASMAVDWRGQGLADRMTPDVALGHVGSFADYQKDVAAVVEAAAALDLPRPLHLLAHSMGGAIGYRALLRGLPVERAAFSAPMWGILISRLLRPLATFLPIAALRLGMGERYAPGTRPASDIAETGFEGNTLTTDPDQYAYMRRQVLHDPRFALGGPSLQWLHEALTDLRDLRDATPPETPTLTGVGTDEVIVDPRAIREIMGKWPGGEFLTYRTGRHELLMERPELRDAFLGAIRAHFSDGEAPAKSA